MTCISRVMHVLAISEQMGYLFLVSSGNTVFSAIMAVSIDAEDDPRYRICDVVSY